MTLPFSSHKIPSHESQGLLDFRQLAGTFFHLFIKDLRAAAARNRRVNHQKVLSSNIQKLEESHQTRVNICIDAEFYNTNEHQTIERRNYRVTEYDTKNIEKQQEKDQLWIHFHKRLIQTNYKIHPNSSISKTE